MIIDVALLKRFSINISPFRLPPLTICDWLIVVLDLNSFRQSVNLIIAFYVHFMKR
jgi:hypothetical protein